MSLVLNSAQSLSETVKSGGGSEKKVVVKEIFGSNLALSDKKVVVINQEQSQLSSEFPRDSSHKQQWTAVKAVHQMVLEKPLSFVMAWLYDQARTYFISQI